MSAPEDMDNDVVFPTRDRNRNPLTPCPDCGKPKLKRAKRCRDCANAAMVGVPRTDTPSAQAGRYRARQLRPKVRCEFEGGCERTTGLHVHHIDGNPLNNDVTNLAVLCPRHHMVVDGRLEAAAARAREIGKRGGRRKAEAST